MSAGSLRAIPRLGAGGIDAPAGFWSHSHAPPAPHSPWPYYLLKYVLVGDYLARRVPLRERKAVAATMIDCIVHHADALALNGAGYRLRGRGIDSLPSIRTTTGQTES